MKEFLVAIVIDLPVISLVFLFVLYKANKIIDDAVDRAFDERNKKEED